MREVHRPLQQPFLNGVKPGVASRQAQFLDECFYMRHEKGILQTHEALQTPGVAELFDGQGELIVNWPFPQLLRSADTLMLVTEDRFYTVAPDWTATERFVAMEYDEVFDIADFIEMLFAANGEYLYARQPNGTWGSLTGTTIPIARSVCNYKGMLVCGGITSIWHDCDEESIAWSEVNLANMEPGRNIAGYARLPIGVIHKVLPLDNFLVAYGSRGIAMMGVVIEPHPGLGLLKLVDTTGVSEKSAITGDDNEHWFRSNNGQVYKLTKDGPQPFGQDYQFPSGQVCASFDTKEQVAYFSHAQGGVQFKEDKATNMCQAITSGVMLDSFNAIALTPVEDLLVVTSPFDLQVRAMKTMQWVEVASSLPVEVAIDWRMSSQDNWVRTVFQRTSPEGAVYIPVAGAEFRLVFKISKFQFMAGEFDYVNIRYKSTDKRWIRGSYNASEASPESDS